MQWEASCLTVPLRSIFETSDVHRSVLRFLFSVSLFAQTDTCSFNVSGTILATTIKVLGDVSFDGFVDISDRLVVYGDASFNEDVDISGTLYGNDLIIRGDASFNQNVDISNHLQVLGDTSLNNKVDISDNLTVSGSIISNGRITIGGDTSLNGEVDITGSLKVAYNTNTSSYLGKANVGFNGYHTDWASFKHVNTDNETGYAFIQNHLGRTFFNAANSEFMGFRINNQDKMVMDKNGNIHANGDINTKKTFNIRNSANSTKGWMSHDTTNKNSYIYLTGENKNW